MKRTVIIFLLLLILIPLIVAETVNGSRYWVIDHYDINVVINDDGVLSVEEKITVNFHGQYHGIIRTLSMEFDTRKINCSAPFAVEAENRELVIKIGDADTLLTGTVEYLLTYEQEPRTVGEFVYAVPGIWSVDVHDLKFSLTIPKDRYYGCAMEIEDLHPAGKTFETTEDRKGNLVIKGTAELVPAYGYIELVLR
jgi:hypothetical protein